MLPRMHERSSKSVVGEVHGSGLGFSPSFPRPFVPSFPRHSPTLPVDKVPGSGSVLKGKFLPAGVLHQT